MNPLGRIVRKPDKWRERNFVAQVSARLQPRDSNPGNWPRRCLASRLSDCQKLNRVCGRFAQLFPVNAVQ